MATKKYMSLERLQEYDALIKQEIADSVSGKADESHNHDDKYYTEAEIDTKLAGKSDESHKHDSLYDAKGAAATVQTNLNTVSDTLSAHTGDSTIHVTAANKTNWNAAHTHSQSTHARTDATKVENSTTNGNILINGTEATVYAHPNSGVTTGTYKSVTINAQGHVTGGTNPTTLAGYGITDAESKGAASSALASAKEYTDSVASGKSDTSHKHDTLYDAKGSADTALASAKTYADSAAKKVKDDLLNGAGGAYDTLKELGDLIDDNTDAIDALETIASGKADAEHAHVISDVTGLQTALDGKADASHGTHVTWSTTTPKMDGTAAVGTETKVARGDHVHPTDTSRAAKTDLDSHVSSTTVHITSTERTNWNAAKTHADSTHAPSNAQANVIESIKVNGTAQTITSKSVNITIPTDNASLTNGAGYLVASDIANKANKSTTLSGYGITDAYTKTQVDAKTIVDSSLSSTSTNAIQNKVVNSAISTLTSAVSANTSSISTHSDAISSLQTAVGEIQEITSAEIRALFA